MLHLGFRVGHNSKSVRKYKFLVGPCKGRNQVCVPPICGVENGVASEVLLEGRPTNIPSDSSGAVILPSASYIESSALHRAEQGTRSAKGVYTLAPLKNSVPSLEEHTEVSPFRPAQLVECFEVEGGTRLLVKYKSRAQRILLWQFLRVRFVQKDKFIFR